MVLPTLIQCFVLFSSLLLVVQASAPLAGACSPIAVADFAKCFTCAEDNDPTGPFLLGPDGTSWSAETWVRALATSCLEASSSVLPSPVPTETAATELPLASTGSDLFSAAPTTSDAVDSSTLLESYSVFSSSSSSSSSDLTPPTTIIEASATTSHSPTATSSLVIVTVVATTPLSSSRFVTSPVLPLTLSQTRTSSSTTKSTLAAASGTGGVGMEVIPGPVRSSTSGAGGRMKGERWVWVGLFVASSTFLLG